MSLTFDHSLISYLGAENYLGGNLAGLQSMKRRFADSDGRSLSCSSTPLSLICPPFNMLSRTSLSDGNASKKGKVGCEQSCRDLVGCEKSCRDLGCEESKIGGLIMGFGDSKGEECSSGREMLQRHRMQVAGKVGIPETWDQEELLKEWVDPKVMDKCLAPDDLFSARTALIRDCNVERNRNAEDLKAPAVSCSQ